MRIYNPKRPPGIRLMGEESLGMVGLWMVRATTTNTKLNVICGDGFGWDHVSVSPCYEKRTPTWDEMCQIKSLWFEDHETVIQFHPPVSQHVNLHPYCLHLWRKQDSSYESPDFLPPSILVG